MTEHLPFLAQVPVCAVLDGELVAVDDAGRPDFPRVCEAVLHRHRAIPLTFVVFDVLSVEGSNVMAKPYSERRLILEQMQLGGSRWQTPEALDDGAALWQAVCEHELEGCRREASLGPRYLCGERGGFPLFVGSLLGRGPSQQAATGEPRRHSSGPRTSEGRQEKWSPVRLGERGVAAWAALSASGFTPTFVIRARLTRHSAERVKRELSQRSQAQADVQKPQARAVVAWFLQLLTSPGRSNVRRTGAPRFGASAAY